MRKLQDLNVRGQRVLLRADLNVPLSTEGGVADDMRIRAVLPTIQWLREHGPERVLIASHLGRPQRPEPRWSLRPVCEVLARLLDAPVELLPVDLKEAREGAEDAASGALLMLENTRFYPGETRNAPDLASELAGFADVFVQDAFGAVHRAHASTSGVPSLLPSAAGLLLQREIAALGGLLGAPARPFTAVLGGAKVSDKIGVIENLLPKVDRILIGGAMANTFLLSQGHPMGSSLVEEDSAQVAADLLEGEWREKIELPVDFVAGPNLDEPDAATVVSGRDVPEDLAAYDIGPETVRRYSELIGESATVFWNGPMGVFEVEGFAQGTYALAAAVAGAEGYTVVGGGDSVAALERSGYAAQVDHISTGGGASLEFLEGQALPGVRVLEEQHA